MVDTKILIICSLVKDCGYDDVALLDATGGVGTRPKVPVLVDKEFTFNLKTAHCQLFTTTLTW